MAKIILATSSPDRKNAFRSLNLNFVTQGANINEYFDGRPNKPEELVLNLAKLKAEEVSKNYKVEIIIGFDSVGVFGGKILEKPKSREEGFQRLKDLSDKTFQFLTGIYMINLKSKKIVSRIVVTDVEMRNIKNSEIEKYLNQDPGFRNYALGFTPLKHYSATFIRRIDGSYNNLTRGIPLETIVDMLSEIGYKLL